MSSCGDIQFLEGGTINGAQISSSQVVSSIVTASSLVSCDIQNLSAIDTLSAQKIADAMALLSPAQLRALADTILAAYSAPGGAAPATAVSTALPTAMYGTRRAVLGEPDAWVKMGNRVMPLYNSPTP